MLTRAAVSALFFTATLAAGQQTPVFKSGVTLVTVDVTVLDKDGKPVPGLAADDFQIKLNGKLQPVRALSYVQVAETAASLTVRDIEPDVTGRKVVTNSAPAGEQKVFVIAIDDLSFAADGGKRTLAGARGFVAGQPADVYIGLTTTSGTPVVNPTHDHAAVIAALKKVTGGFVDPRRPMVAGGPTVGIAEAIEIVDYNDSSTLGNVLNRECGGDAALLNKANQTAASQCANNTQSQARLIASTVRGVTSRQIAALTAAINAMKGASGLKQLVVLSEGIGSTRDIAQILDPIGRAAAAAGVEMSVVMEDVDETDLSDTGHSASETGAVQTDTGMSNRIRDDKRMFRSSMQTLADISGGTFEYVIGQADKAFERVAVAGSAVYRIGVEAPSDATAAKPIFVTASVRRPGLAVHANRQAVLPGPAAQPTAAEQVTAAIKEGQPLFIVPIRLAVARRRAASNQIELGIGMEVPASVKGPLTMTFGVVDQKGELRQGSRPLAAPAAGADYRLTFPMPVAPGKYSLRFAVTDATGSVGSIDTAIDATLAAMSTLNASDVLTWWTDTAGKAQFLALDEVPSGVANLGAGIELYPQPGTNFPEDVKVKMSLVPAGKTEPLIQKDVTPLLGDNMLRAEAMLPLANVPAGSYVLKATVTVAGKPIGEASALINKK
jgi:VWFA-related protein